MKSKSHLIACKTAANTQNIQDVLVTTFDAKVATAEIKMAGFIASLNLPMCTMDVLSPLCKELFPDSKIASKLKCKRTKTTEIITKVLGT